MLTGLTKMSQSVSYWTHEDHRMLVIDCGNIPANSEEPSDVRSASAIM